MPATLIWGKGFRRNVNSGELSEEIIGVDGGTEFVSWSSVDAMQSLAEQHGVNRHMWPVYPDCEVESDVPLEDAERRSVALRIALEQLDSRVVEGDYWLNRIRSLLRGGNAFFVMV